uniref:DUF6751 family protein n=1 Tax=Blautia stercoris TaxID=871664 RepID=UPI004026125B
MIVNADITLYNRKLDKGTRQYIYKRTILYGVHWYTDQKVTVSDKGLDSADSIKIRIPMAERRETFLEPEEYARKEDVTGFFTASNGDVFVKGILEDEIAKESDLEKKGLLFGRILSHSDNRRGLEPHIRIGGA